MSLFDYPRINFSGACTLNPGTANNADYSGSYSWPPTGQNLSLIDSATVQPLTFGMSDDDFRLWIQNPQTFTSPQAQVAVLPAAAALPVVESLATQATTHEVIPAEWNYYGNMSLNVTAPVTGVQFDPAAPPSPGVQSALTQLIGGSLSFSGNITDVNSEGSPPATQFFIDPATLRMDNIGGLGGTPGKGACQWINFLRNVNMTADGGAGGYIYHVIPNGHRNLPGFDGPGICGIILRYYLYARHGGVADNASIAALYKQQKTNPAELQITGTIAPLYASETVLTGPVGRLLTATVPNVEVPAGNTNNLSQSSGQPDLIPLAPAVLAVNGDRISLDAIASFPEQHNASGSWSDPNVSNPKFDFGPVTLTLNPASGKAVPIGTIDYADTAAGNACGWIFDFDISANPVATALLSNPTACFFSLEHPKFGATLSETDYYVTTNAQAAYAEQNGAPNQFRIQGQAMEPASFQIFRRGLPLSPAETPPITVWFYRTTPLGSCAPREMLQQNYVPGTPISIPVDQPGTFLLTLQIGDEPPPPATYNDYIGPNFTVLTNRTGISLRILPNEDYSQYYSNPGAAAPVGNDQLTFELVYQNVLRTYDLLFPAMRAFIDLGDEAAVGSNAGMILARTDPANWALPTYMPITRDLSDSRRTLLQAWCRKPR